MQLTERLREYISACFTGIWIQSHEHQDAIAEIIQLCGQESWRLACWDLEQGLTIPGAETALEVSDPSAARSAVTFSARLRQKPIR